MITRPTRPNTHTNEKQNSSRHLTRSQVTFFSITNMGHQQRVGTNITMSTIRQLSNTIQRGQTSTNISTVRGPLHLTRKVTRRRTNLLHNSVNPPPLISLNRSLHLQLPTMSQRARNEFNSRNITTRQFRQHTNTIKLSFMVPQNSPSFATMFRARLHQARRVTNQVGTRNCTIIRRALTMKRNLRISILTRAQTRGPFTKHHYRMVLVTTVHVVTININGRHAFRQTPQISMRVPNKTMRAFQTHSGGVRVILLPG